MFRKKKDDEYLKIENPVKDLEKWGLNYDPATNVMQPYVDAPPINPYIDYKQCQKKLFLTNAHLDSEREGASKKQEVLEYQWREMQMKEKMLRDNFMKFNRFLKVNLEKRERAIKKLGSDHELYIKRIQDIEGLKKQLILRRGISEKFIVELRKLFIYTDFLQRFIEYSNGEFKDPIEPLKRMEVLYGQRSDLHERQVEELHILENAKRRKAEYLEEKTLQVTGLNNTLATLRSKYEDTVRQTLGLEKIILELKVTMCEMDSNLKRLQTNIGVIYAQVCRRKQVTEKLKKKKVEDQLGELSQSLKTFEFLTERKPSRRNTLNMRK